MPLGINAAGPRGQRAGSTLKIRAASTLSWSDFTRDADVPLNGTFPYYSDGVAGESYGKGDYKATNGRLYKVSTSGAGTPLAWYPAPGNRGSSTGVLWGVGNHGYSYSSSANGNNGMYLNVYVTGLYTSSADPRAYGFQLRCRAEETPRARGGQGAGVTLKIRAASTLLLFDFGGPEPAWAQRASRSGGPTPGVAPARATLRVVRAKPIRPRRAPLAPLMRRPCRGRRFPSESRYLLLVKAGRKSSARFSAPCQYHCGSAAAPPRLPSPAAILAGLAECQPAEYALLSGRATFFARNRVFSRVILCPRALGNLVKTRKRILTISLLRRGARLV